MLDLPRSRERMVESQIARRGIASPDILEAMRATPREDFVEPGFEEFAYDDGPLPIGEGQTISQPYIVALMIDAAGVKRGDRVLEIGTGSGYSAAVVSRIADRVYSIERHPALSAKARDRFAALGYGNIELRVGDGTLGWPEVAPFDAILVTAGGPDAPPALKAQLKIGGRLVIPIGTYAGDQTLLKITRVSETEFEEDDLGGVRFVPLIGEQGFGEDGAKRKLQPAPAQSLPEMIAAAAEPLPDLDDPAFGALFDRYADRKIVLLGEASHGTSEFYRARAAITRRLIAQHGFTILAVEADWPDAAAVDRYVRHRAARPDAEPPFQRFPTWMWRNAEVADLIGWMRDHNAAIPEMNRRAGFYGLDLYNMGGSIGAVLEYLDKVDPEAAQTARQRYGCLTPWQREPSTYGRAVLRSGYRKCEQGVVQQLREILQRRLDYAAQDSEGFLDAAQNARLIEAAERYYRIMYYGGAESWNLRDTHMFETLVNLLDARGPQSKAVVWAHNSHIGDARHTDMGQTRDELNLGQLCRERFGGEAALIGFGTHTGTVAAATDWDGEMEVKRVRPSRRDSYEGLCHDSGIGRFLLDLQREGPMREKLLEQRLERFIGVIYRPDTELMSHYAEASLPQQFDAWVWFDETSAVTPLGPEHGRQGVPDTYPFGL